MRQPDQVIHDINQMMDQQDRQEAIDREIERLVLEMMDSVITIELYANKNLKWYGVVSVSGRMVREYEGAPSDDIAVVANDLEGQALEYCDKKARESMGIR